MSFVAVFCVVALSVACVVVSKAEQASATFSVVSGITAREEYCLSAGGGGIGVEGAPLVLESCAMAVSLGDGRELFSLQPGGQLLNVPGGKCASVGKDEVTEGAVVYFVDCDTAAQWEVQSNGQLKLNVVGDFCLTQEGGAPGRRDLAANAAGMASSTANAFSHGAFMALDSQLNTFWASKFDDIAEPVEFLVDLGASQPLQSMEIAWEFPARAFSVSLSDDGVHFSEVFATDANMLPTTRVALGGGAARKVRIMMREPHPTHASFQGHLLYGIKTISVFADGLRAVVSDCAKAAKSSDARDKYFLSSVSEADLSPAKAVRSEMPSLEAAKAALAATISELVDALPRLEICGVQSLSRQRIMQNAMQTREQTRARVGHATLPNVFDVDDLDGLLIQARAAVISIRSALA